MKQELSLVKVQHIDIEQQVKDEELVFNRNDSQFKNGIDISFQDIQYSIKKKQKSGEVSERQIIKGVSGVFKAGQLNAILGSSGAGKTTLLNILALRIQKGDQNVELTGKIKANNLEYSDKQFPKFASYVMQDDRLMESMTVRETLRFAVDLRQNLDYQQKEKKIDEIIDMLNLSRAQHTLIGGNFLKGISGGERKRVSIGFELACDPRVLLLDEPTSGLDSFTAFLLIMVLKRYAERGKTIIFTIHQPSADIWNLFDKILLMVDGKLIYQGKGQSQILDYFNKIGFECPKNRNPADYFMSIMQITPQNQQKFPIFFNSYKELLSPEINNQLQSLNQSEVSLEGFQTSASYQSKILMKRSILNIKRNPLILKARVIMNILISLLMGAIYYKLDNGESDPTNMKSIQDKNGFLFFYAVMQFMLGIQPTILSFPLERAVFLKESNLQMYGTWPYFVGKSLPEIPFQFILPMICNLIIYWMVDLNDSDPTNFFKSFLIIALMCLNGNSLGLLLGSLFNDPKVAVAMFPLIMMPFMLFGGFFSNRSSFQAWIGWLEYLSPFKYGFQGLAINEYENTNFRPNPLTSLDFELTFSQNVYIMIGLFGAYRILSYASLRYHAERLQ